MLELGGGAGFALEALDEFLIERQGERQNLDRDFAVELFFLRLEDDRHAPAAELVEDFVFLVELLAHHIDFRDLRLDAHAGRRRRGQVETARIAELRGVLILRATAGAIQFSLRGVRANLGFAPKTVNRVQKSAPNAAYTRACPVAGCATPRRRRSGTS